MTKREVIIQIINELPLNQEFTVRELAQHSKKYNFRWGFTRMEITHFLTELKAKGKLTYREIIHDCRPLGLWHRKVEMEK